MSVYLDHNASTPLHAEVLEEMMPFLKTRGNASSLHKSGRFLRSAIDTARARVAESVNASPEAVIFTSGGTEANNLALKGFVKIGAHSSIMASQQEHASVLNPLQQLQQSGCSTQLLAVDVNGVVDVETARQQIYEFSPDLLSIQLANNETGVVQPVETLARFSHLQQNILVHCDATQGIGKLDVDYQQLDIDLMTLSAHKFQGPQGVGALIVESADLISPLQSGGYQESARRAGTENVALLVGMGKAAELARINLQQKQSTLLELRRYFERQLADIDGVVIFGEKAERLPNTSYFAIPYYHGETLLMQLDKKGFELASGSACHSEVTQPSHVLKAMGIAEDLALNAVRVSFGVDNTFQQVDQLIGTLNDLINQLPAVMRQVAH